MPLEKIERPRPTLTVRPGGSLAGHTFLMHRISARTWVALQAGELEDGELISAALDAVADSTVPEDQPLDLAEAMQLGAAWAAAHRELALPPENGTGSEEP